MRISSGGLVGLVAMLLGQVQVSGQAIDPPHPQAIEGRISQFESAFTPENRLSGVLLVAEDDEIIFHKPFGYASVELQAANRLETRFCIASITKELTRLVVIELLVEGKLALNDLVSRWLPEFPHGGEITVGNVLRFRAGVPHRVTSAAEESQPTTASMMSDRIAQALGRDGLLVEPGSKSHYSSATYTLLARIVELVEDKPFGQVLQERVFGPAGMDNSAQADNVRLLEGRAQSYVPGAGELWNAPLKDLSFLIGAGSVYSTAEDMFRLVRALRRDVFHTAVTQNIAQNEIHWMGATNGFFAFVDEHDGLVVVFLGNSWGGAAGQLRDQIPRLVRGDEPIAPRDAPATGAVEQTVDDYLGDYQSRPGAFTHVRQYDGQLVVADSAVLPVKADTFFHQAWQSTITFLRDDSGQVTAMQRGTGPDVQVLVRRDD